MTDQVNVTVPNKYLDVYRAAAEHQASCPGALFTMSPLFGREAKYPRPADLQRRYAWAIPNDAALDAIAAHSPSGVVEIGAGGGYWTMLLRARGIDVIAYDPEPAGGGEGDWHDGRGWSEVLTGDHTSVIGHPDRTLLLVWPSYDQPWTDEVLDLYDGDTVVYVGEGSGGCTGTDRMHDLLGADSCWHDDDEECDYEKTPARFSEIADIDIPQWSGLHDRLHIYRRRP